MLKRDVPDFERKDPLFQAKLFGPLAKLILKKDFKDKTLSWNHFSDEFKQDIILEGEKFKQDMGNFSFVPQREKASRHPLFMLAKHLMEKNEIYYWKFWMRFQKRREKSRNKDKFKRLVNKELAQIPSLEPSHFLQ